MKSSKNAPNSEIPGSVRFIALTVSDLRRGEEYYQTVFAMEIIGREAMLANDVWHTLPFDKGWNEAQAAGIALGMVALRKGNFVLVLFKGDEVYNQVYAIGLAETAEEIARIRARLAEGAEILEEGPAYLSFRDPYQVTWQIALPGVEFRTAGDIAGRWLQV